MRLFLLLVFGCMWIQPVAAQEEPQPDPFYLQLVSTKMDSMRKAGIKDKHETYPVGCRHPDHLHLFLILGGFTVPRTVFDLREEKLAHYVRVYAMLMKASELYEQKNYAAANRIWKAVMKLTREHNFHYEELHVCRKSLNHTSFLSGDYPEAMRVSAEGIRRAREIGDSTMMGHFSNVIGYIHMRQANFPEANRYFTEYLVLTRATRDTLHEAHALYNLGDLHTAQGSTDSAIHFLQLSLRAYRTLRHKYTWFNLAEREGYIANKMAQVSLLRGELAKALDFSREGVHTARFAPGVNEYDRAEYYIRAAEVFNELQRPDSAIFHARRGLEIAERIRHREHMAYGYGQLATAFAKLRLYDSAWAWSVVAQKLRDSLTRESSRRDILLHETDLSMEREQAKQQAALEKQRIWRNFFLGLTLFTILTAYLLYNRYRLRQENRMQAELNRQQQEILRTTIEVQDRERKRIAEDLHDSLGSLLSVAKLKLSTVNGASGNGENGKLQEAMSLLDEAIADMKHIAYNIMPATLSRLGLIAAMQNLFSRLENRAGLQVHFSAHGFEQRLEERMEVSLYRIVLEGVTNVVKHAGARTVTVQLIRYPAYINLTIEDDGKGFAPQTAEIGNGLGNMDSRVRNLGGTLHFDSAPGRGTTVLVDIPCES